MPVVIDRHRTLLALVLGALTGCPPPTTNSPVSAPAAAPVSSQAYFVRLTSLTIGGDFDGSGTEEVQVLLKTNQESRRLYHAERLDLPDDSLRTFDLPGGGLIEVPAFPRSSLELEAYDVDVTGSELICGGSVEVALEAYGEEASPGRATADLGTIRGIAGGLFDARKTFTIPGAACTLALVRAPRRDAPDETSRAQVAELFAAVLEAKAPANGADARALHESLRETLRRAEARAEGSTHTHLRKAVPDLVAAGRPLLDLLAGPDGPTPKELLERLDGVRTALAKVPPPERAGRAPLFADVQALVDAGVPASEAPALQAAASRVGAARLALVAPATTSEPPGEPALEDALARYGEHLERAERALAAIPEAGARLAALQKAVRDELGTN